MALAQPIPLERGSPRRIPTISMSEWRWLGIVTVLLLVTTVLPLVVAAWRVPPGSVFPGYVVIARDAYVYQALWRAGWHGAWLFRSSYTSEALPGILLYPWYLWSGHLVGGLPGAALYHAGRLAAAGALTGTSYALAAQLFRPTRLRRWAFTLGALGGGVGVLLPSVQLGPLNSRATEMASPGSSVADLVAMAPHLPFAMAMMCAIFVIALKLRTRRSWRLVAAGLVLTLGLQLIYPQLALLAVGVIGGWSALRKVRAALWFAVAAAAVQAPYLLYLLWVMRQHPEALAVVRPTLDVGDPFGFLVLSHLIATALVLVALFSRRLRGDLLLPALWIVGMTLFMFTPGIRGTLGRSFMASSIPFGLCAVPGLLTVLSRLQTRRWRRRVLTVILAASSLYGLFSLAQPLWIASFRLDERAEYERADEASLLARLAPQVTDRTVVLTTYLDGLFVPAQTDARVYAGHPEMTIDAPRKATEAVEFFGVWPAGQRDTFLSANGIDYVLAPDPASSLRLIDDPMLQLVDRQGSAAIYRVRR